MILISITGAVSFCHLKTSSIFSPFLLIFTFHIGYLSFLVTVNPDLAYAADRVTAGTLVLCN